MIFLIVLAFIIGCIVAAILSAIFFGNLHRKNRIDELKSKTQSILDTLDLIPEKMYKVTHKFNFDEESGNFTRFIINEIYVCDNDISIDYYIGNDTNMYREKNSSINRILYLYTVYNFEKL